MKSPKVIDLFSGVGGLSLGAERAGFHVIGAIELDSKALESHKKNFPLTKHIQQDIQELTGEKILEYLNIEDLDGIIGGPPCQGFSNMGKGNVDDSRNNLFIQFFKIVSEIQPSFFIAENVPGILNDKYSKIRNEAYSHVQDYIMLPAIKVKATDFGAPTSRTRIFFIGYKEQHFENLCELDFTRHYVPSSALIKVRESFEGLATDLNPIKNNESIIQINNSTFDRYPYYFSRITGNIPSRMRSPYQTNYKKHQIANGFNKTIHSPTVVERFKNLSFGEQDKISRATKLDPTGIAPTLRAGTGSDKGSFQAVRPIHYSENRVITPREAARIQGFPDWFEFDKTIWHSFRQIGNSVSPLVAEGILTVIHQKLTSLK